MAAPARKGTDKRGGKRPGAGRPKGSKSVNDRLGNITRKARAQIIEDVIAVELKAGKTVGTALGELMMYGDSDRTRLSAMQTYFKDVLPREAHTEVDVDVKHNVPSIYLPQREPDPADVIEMKVVNGTAERK